MIREQRTRPPEPDQTPTMLRSLELFTGAGGLALGTHYGGFRHSGLLEWNRDACATLRENVQTRSIPGISHWDVIEGDVRSVTYRDFGPVDLIAGGPPCQPFSIGGKHRGMRDDRDMIPEFMRAIRELRPRSFLFENVKGLTRKTFRNYLRYLLLQFCHPDVEKDTDSTWEDHLARLEEVDRRGSREGLHYRVWSGVLNAADFGVPQVRHRIFIVGFRIDVGRIGVSRTPLIPWSASSMTSGYRASTGSNGTCLPRRSHRLAIDPPFGECQASFLLPRRHGLPCATPSPTCRSPDGMARSPRSSTTGFSRVPVHTSATPAVHWMSPPRR